MDPWKVTEERRQSDLEPSKDFEDNFIPTVGNILGDSEQYLATLENKLKKLKSDPNVLRQLSERHEASMIQLLRSGLPDSTDESPFNNSETLHLDTPVAESTLLRTLLPQRQALTVGESVQLVHYDQLDQQEENQEDSESTTSR